MEVRSADEIQATLDDEGGVEGLPFMPEMLQYCGRRFRVFRSAHKTADTIELFAIRRMANAVHLEKLRCDGAAHGGCQASCLLFWKESWLKRLPSGDGLERGPGGRLTADGVTGTGAGGGSSLSERTRLPSAAGRPDRYRCQATEMLKATTEVRRRERFDPRFYVRDLTSGNVRWVDFIRFGSLAMVNAFLRRWFGLSFPRIRGRAGDTTPTGELHLQEGEMVRVKAKREIERTLSRHQRNRGLWFDAEMVPYCGKAPYRVSRRVRRIINEKTGEMLTLSNPCIVLEGVYCSGNYLHYRMFSPRCEPMYFREIWLERLTESPADAPSRSGKNP